jgi:hypothetical protein
VQSGKPNTKDASEQALSGTLLGNEGRELKKGLWERSVYLGKDGFVYQLEAGHSRGALKTKVVSKRKVGDYLRWVDGLFAPGGLPDQSNAIHYRSARVLRELI